MDRPAGLVLRLDDAERRHPVARLAARARRTRRASRSALVGLVRVVPIVVFSLVGGVVADALDRRRLMLITQTGMTLVAAALALADLRGLTALWPIYVLTALGRPSARSTPGAPVAVPDAGAARAPAERDQPEHASCSSSRRCWARRWAGC